MTWNELKKKIDDHRGVITTKNSLKFLIGPLTILGVFFGLRFYKFFRHWFKPERRPIKKTPADYGLTYEQVRFKNGSPLPLRGWFIPAQQKSFLGKSPTIILCHGWPANREEVLNRVPFLASHYNLFLFDFRAMGKSPGAFTSFGLYEQRDLKAAIKYVQTRPEVDKEKIGLFGFSMGGSVALMTATRFPSLKALVAESPYANLADIIKYIFRDKSLKQKVMVQLAIVFSRLFIHVDPRKVAPVEAVRDLHIPLFILTSRNDQRVPFSHAQRIFEAANQPKSFWGPTGSEHGQIIDDYPAEYQQAVRGFFDQYLR